MEKTASQRGRASKAKGKHGELEVAKALTESGFPARRAQQFKGTSDSGDIDCPAFNALGVHVEVKRTELYKPYDWLSQCARDIGDKTGLVPTVVHRRSGKPWVAVMHLDDLLTLLRKVHAYTAAE